jgi:hypothetical protein
MMKARFFSLCGLFAPILFSFTAILGGALRPGYSHLADTVSELFSPGSPNKPLLDTLHTIYALLLICFGVGILQYVRRVTPTTRSGTVGAWLYIVMGAVSVTTATIFPQDAWGTPPTFPGQMHMIMHGVISILSMGSMLLIGHWFHQAELSSGFQTYSILTVGVAILGAGYFMANMGSPIMGLAERIAGLIGFQWTLILSLRISFASDSKSDKAQSVSH